MFDKRKDNTKESSPSRQPRDARDPARPPVPQPARVPTEQRAATTKATIGATIVIKGELSGDEDILVAGEFEGSIDLPNHALTVVRSGQVKADVRANTVEIQGEIQGDIDGIDKVQITKTGRMQGNITSPRVILDDGAIFKGRIDMEPAPPPPAKPAPPPKRAAASAAKPTVPPTQAGQPAERSGSS